MSGVAKCGRVVGGTLLAAVALTLGLAPFVLGLKHGRLLTPLQALDTWLRPIWWAISPRPEFMKLRAPWMQDTGQWWMTVAVVFAVSLALVVVGWWWVDVRIGVTRLGRRWFELRGARPRAWARPRDLRSIWMRRDGAGMQLGSIGWLQRRLAVGPEAHVALFAPTGAGKSSRFIIPWVTQLDRCPLVVCSTKADVIAATSAHRARLGRVWVWDPFGPRSSGWSPLRGCETWTGALKRAKWIAGASTEGDSAAARFWNGEAAKLLAPLLHAAALNGVRMGDVLRWLDRPSDGVAEASGVLASAGADSALDQLQAVAGLDERNRGTTFMSAAHLLEAYRYPSVQATDRAEIAPVAMLDGRANTLYVIATDDEQRLLAPLVIAMLGELLAERDRTARSAASANAPTLWLLLDETANIAPLEDLPRQLAGKRGSNVRFVTVWQDHAQLRRAYGSSDGTILSNSTVKLYLGPITDDLTRRYLDGLLGEERVDTIAQSRSSGRSRSQTWRPRASSQAQQQLGRGRALLLYAHLLAALIETRPWFAPPRLRLSRYLVSGTNKRPDKQKNPGDQDSSPVESSAQRFSDGKEP